MVDYTNLLPRLQNAREEVTSRRGSPKDNLASAYVYQLSPLMTKEFPPRVQPLWDELQAAMRRVPDEQRGSARASIDAMTGDEVKRLCELVVRICNEVEMS